MEEGEKKVLAGEGDSNGDDGNKRMNQRYSIECYYKGDFPTWEWCVIGYATSILQVEEILSRLQPNSSTVMRYVLVK